MPFEIIRNDITHMHVDAIVNAANTTLLGGGGVDGAIHRAAGPGLLAECRTLHGCNVGDAKLTGAYDLPCKYVIHTVGPVWQGGTHSEEMLLTSCYRQSLHLARKHGCRSIAFPLISAGAYGYPRTQALRVAADTIREFLEVHDMQVYLVVFDHDSFHTSERLYAGVQAYIDDHYARKHFFTRAYTSWTPSFDAGAPTGGYPPLVDAAPMCTSPTLENALRQMDESFSQMVLRKIDEKGITDVACYKKANLDRKLFSKIRSDVHYKPSKRTALALAVALELPLEETNDLLRKAGFALSHSSKFDVIIEYYILRGVYDIWEINEALFHFDQSLLGG